MAKKDPRFPILRAVDHVLDRHGLKGLTIDRVAAEAKMSKGGVLYYFASKDELLTASLLGFKQRFFDRRDAFFTSLPPTPARLARATFLALMETRKLEAKAGYYRPDLLENLMCREIISSLKKQIFQDILKGARRPELVLALLFFFDGIWLNGAYNPSPVPEHGIGRAQAGALTSIESMWEEYE